MRKNLHKIIAMLLVICMMTGPTSQFVYSEEALFSDGSVVEETLGEEEVSTQLFEESNLPEDTKENTQDEISDVSDENESTEFVDCDGELDVFTDTEVLTAGSFSGKGRGTKDDPYQIISAKQMNEVRNNLSAHYVLKADIDLTEYENWVPIGKNGTGNAFTGTFDGLNHTIRGMSIRRIPNLSYYGLFGFGSWNKEDKSAQIRNLNISDSEIILDSRDDSVGLLIGGGEEGTISNCTVGGKIIIEDYAGADGSVTAGGLMGGNYYNNILMDNCINNASLDIVCAFAEVGGISGKGNSYSNCVNKGSIKILCTNVGGSVSCGGISGNARGDFSRCINNGTIDAAEKEYTSGVSSAGAYRVGGIAGNHSGDNVFGCVNTGNLKGNNRAEKNTDVGGIFGWTHADKMENCYNLGNISSNVDAGRIYSKLEGGWIIRNLYSADYATINNIIPKNELGADKKNGEPLSAVEIQREINRNIYGDAAEISSCEIDVNSFPMVERKQYKIVAKIKNTNYVNLDNVKIQLTTEKGLDIEKNYDVIDLVKTLKTGKSTICEWVVQVNPQVAGSQDLFKYDVHVNADFIDEVIKQGNIYTGEKDGGYYGRLITADWATWTAQIDDTVYSLSKNDNDGIDMNYLTKIVVDYVDKNVRYNIRNGLVTNVKAVCDLVDLTDKDTVVVRMDKQYSYTGKSIWPDIEVYYSGKKLKSGYDYAVTYKNNTKIGTATAQIVGMNDYVGTRAEKFYIVSDMNSLADASVSGIKSQYFYTGKEIKPSFSVALYDNKLTKNKDYSVSYSNNKKIGTAVVTITGIGKYKGSKKIKFKIVKAYQVTYNANKGSGAPSAQKFSLEQGAKLSSQEPTRKGYSFQGWCKSANKKDGDKIYYGGKTYKFSKNVKLYAIWEKIIPDSVKSETLSAMEKEVKKAAVLFAQFFTKKAQDTSEQSAKKQLEELGNELSIYGTGEDVPDEIVEAFAKAVLNTLSDANIDEYEVDPQKLTKQIYGQIKSGLKSESVKVTLGKGTAKTVYEVDYTIMTMAFGGIAADMSWAKVQWRDAQNKFQTVHIISNAKSESMKEALAAYCGVLAQLNKRVWTDFMVKYVTGGVNFAGIKLDEKTVSKFFDRSEKIILTICGDKNAKEKLGEEVKSELKDKFTKMTKTQLQNYIKRNVPYGDKLIKSADQYKKVKEKYDSYKKYYDTWKKTKKDSDADKCENAYQTCKDMMKQLDTVFNSIP